MKNKHKTPKKTHLKTEKTKVDKKEFTSEEILADKLDINKLS